MSAKSSIWVMSWKYSVSLIFKGVIPLLLPLPVD